MVGAWGQDYDYRDGALWRHAVSCVFLFLLEYLVKHVVVPGFDGRVIWTRLLMLAANGFIPAWGVRFGIVLLDLGFKPHKA